jgi:4-hydroxy-tetrahydrodipicolinate synthase
MQPTLAGSFVALPTPFRGADIDFEAFAGLVEYHVEADTDGIVVAGTTGESSTLSEHEHRSLIHAAVERAHGRIAVVAGVGTNNTQESVELARFAGACGADALLVVTPYYNRPSRKGLLLHYGAIAEATSTPMILYNVPSRTGTDLGIDLVRELGQQWENIVGIKECTNSTERIRELVQESGLSVFCGEDGRIADFMQYGAAGAIGVIGNLLPNEIAELIRTARPGGDSARAAALVEQAAPLVRDLYIEVNPVPLKHVLASLELCSAEVRLPLAPLEEASARQLESTIRACRSAGLLGHERHRVSVG